MLILAAIGSPSASRNLGQNQIIWQFTVHCHQPCPVTGGLGHHQCVHRRLPWRTRYRAAQGPHHPSPPRRRAPSTRRPGRHRAARSTDLGADGSDQVDMVLRR